MKIDFFKDRIFAITPKGDVIDLPEHSTPVDFAYHIHSEVGNSCSGAKVNDALVPLDHELKSGDMVEIVIQKGRKPSEDWLKFVKTSIARDHIKVALRQKNLLARKAQLPTKTELKIAVDERIGLIKDISTVIARSHISILAFEAKQQPGSRFSIDRVEINTTDRQKIEKLILKLKKIHGVREVGYKLT
jgi:(p)ppGpp synthase/HD superfamily hydrolase